MTISPDLATKGTAEPMSDGAITFQPLNSNYTHHLVADGGLAGRGPARGVIHVRARKVYTVPSGGTFVTPIIGVPKIIQGRVLTLDERTIVVRAAATFVVELPTGEDSVDLRRGDIAANSLVNVVVMPGARFERVG